MHISIRQYRSTGEVAEFAARVEESFVPLVRSVEGFAGYYFVDLGGQDFITISVAESRAAVEETAERARSWVREHASDLVEGAPSVVNGRVLVQG